jgi:uncharacterized membrane protein YgaE (UPF0421/DUF939 family)
MVRFGRMDRLILEDSVRTALAGVASYLIAQMLGMSEAYWATFSALIVTQSSLGAAATISWQRLAATFLGAGMGAVLGSYFHANLVMFGVGVFLLGILCALLRVGMAYRFAAVTLTVIVLIPRNHAAWIVAAHRLVEVSVGIAVGLVFSALWPGVTTLQRQEAAALEAKESGKTDSDILPRH